MSDSTDTRALLLTIQANTELLRSNLSAAERSLVDFTASTQRHLDASDAKFASFGHSIEKLQAPLERLKGLAEFGIGAVLGESLIEAGKKGLEFAGNIQFVSEQVGTSTKFLQEYRFAASQYGVANAEADTGLQKFARSIGEAANGNKASIAVFDRLGVKVRDSAGNVRSVETVYLDVANAIAKIPDPAQRTADTMELLGRGAAALTPLLSSGADGFNQLAGAARELGIVLSPELIEHSEDVNHKLAALKQVVDAQMASAIAQNAGNILFFATAIEKLAGAFAKLQKEHPETSMEVLGGMIGLRVGGVPGAAAGAAIGAVGGHYIARQAADESTDLDVRRQEFERAKAKYEGLVHLRRSSGGNLGSDSDFKDAVADLLRQRDKYVAAAKLPHPKTDARLGSTDTGTTNDNGDDLKGAQARLSQLEGQKTHASGAALAAINQEIAAQKRKIAFINQGADAALADSLAAKQGSIESKGESAAKAASRKAEEERRRAIENDRAYAAAIGQADNSLAQARVKLADTADARYQLEAERLRAELAAHDQEVDDQVAAGKYTPAQGLTLKIKYGTTEQLGETGADRDRRGSNMEQATALSQLDLQGKIDLLGLQDRLATTARQRLAIELQLLDYQEQLAKAAQQEIIDNPTSTKDQRDQASARIGQIDAQHPANVALLQRQNEGPLASYRDGLQSSVGDTATDIGNLEVTGLNSLEDGLLAVGTGAKSAKAALRDFVMSALQDLEKLALERGLLSLFDKLIPGGSSASSGGGGGMGFGGFKAGGGGVNDNQFYVVGENGPEIFAPGQSGTIIPNHAIVPARVPDSASIGAARQAAQAQSMRLALSIEPNEMFDVRARQHANDVVDQRKPELVGSSVAATRDLSARRVISMSSR